MQFKWEQLEGTWSSGTERAWVPDGWLIRTTSDWHGKLAVAMVFMSDLTHEWSPDAPKREY